MRRTMIIMVICALLASVVVGMLIGQMGGGGNRDIEPVLPTEAEISTPVATPLDLPPFFRPLTARIQPDA